MAIITTKLITLCKAITKTELQKCLFPTLLFHPFPSNMQRLTAKRRLKANNGPTTEAKSYQERDRRFQKTEVIQALWCVVLRHFVSSWSPCRKKVAHTSFVSQLIRPPPSESLSNSRKEAGKGN